MGDSIPILIVDDDKTICQLFSNFLTIKPGIEPLTAEDAYNGLLRLKERPDIELILLDWMMPGMDAMEFVRKIKKLKNSPKIVMITCKSDPDDVLTAIDAGVVDYLVKPVTKDRLIRKVNMILGTDPEMLKQQASRRVKVNFQAKTEFSILDINYQGCDLLSTFPLDEGITFVIEIPKVAKAIGLNLDHRFNFKVIKSLPLNGKYKIVGEFMGLNMNTKSELKTCCRYGVFL